MMKGKFRYILLGSGLTLLTLISILSLLFVQAQAGEESLSLQDVSHHDVVQEETVFSGIDSDVQSNEIQQNEIQQNEIKPIEQTIFQGEFQAEDQSVSWIQSNDPEIILTMLKQMRDAQENNLAHQGGWLNITISGPELHESVQSNRDDYYGPNGSVVPAESMHPSGASVISSWYYVNNEASVEQGLTFVSDAESKIYQSTFLEGNEWINVTLVEHGFEDETASFPANSNRIGHYLPIEEVIQFLNTAVSTNKEFEETSFESYTSQGRYHLIVRSQFATPIEFGAPIPEAVIGAERHFIFDGINKNLISDTHYFTLQNGDEFLAGISEYHTSPLIPQLPLDVQSLFEKTRQTVQER